MPKQADNAIALIGVEDPFSIEVFEVAGRLDLNVSAGILTGEPGWEPKMLSIVLQSDEVSERLVAVPAAIGANRTSVRYRIHKSAREIGFRRFPALVDPSAQVARSATIGAGVFVNSGAVVAGGAEVNDFATINRNASLGHHCVMDEYSTIGPGAIVASSCRICRGATLGAGAVLKPDIIVGEGAIVGAGAVVVKDVDPGAVVVGNPARRLKDSPRWASAIENVQD